jgi:hypothetical protein
MKKIIVLFFLFFVFFIVSCASVQHKSGEGSFAQSFEATCRVYDDEQFFGCNGIYKGSEADKGSVKNLALASAQNECRMKMLHTYKGMISDFSQSSGNNIETKITQAGEQIIDAEIGAAEVKCSEFSTVDSNGNIEAYIGIRISKRDFVQKLADKFNDLLTDEEKTQIDFNKNEYIKRTTEHFEEEKSAYNECVDNPSEECLESYLYRFPSENHEHIESAKNLLKLLKVKPGAAKALKQAREIKNSGISLIVIGTAIAAGGLAGFFIESDREHDKYNSMATSVAIENAVNNGEDKAAYINRADKHRDKSNLYRNLAITSGVVGGAVAITGVTLTIVGIKKRNHLMNKKIKSVSFVPVEKGFFASLSFDF